MCFFFNGVVGPMKMKIKSFEIKTQYFKVYSLYFEKNSWSLYNIEILDLKGLFDLRHVKTNKNLKNLRFFQCV